MHPFDKSAKYDELEAYTVILVIDSMVAHCPFANNRIILQQALGQGFTNLREQGLWLEYSLYLRCVTLQDFAEEGHSHYVASQILCRYEPELLTTGRKQESSGSLDMSPGTLFVRMYRHRGCRSLAT